MKIYVTLISICFALVTASNGQTVNYLNDSLYYHSWVGEWYQEIDGNVNSEPTFIIRRGLYHSSFEEYWVGTGGNFSMAWRAWDSRTKKWDFAWMSSDGLFQIWEGKKQNDRWYMYNTFIINDEKVLSRQAFIPLGGNLLIRTSEHSRDQGKTWTLRFEERYIKDN